MSQDPRAPQTPAETAADTAADAGGLSSVPDTDLPEDLQPRDDNPLAQPAGDDVPDDILTQGVGHGHSEGSPEDDSASGNGDVVGDDDTSTTSSDEPSSGSGSAT